MHRDVKAKLEISLLYAEDEAVTRAVFCEVLSTKVRTVYQAANGKEGLEIFRQFRPDVVMVDINMPGMNGLGMAAAIKAIAPATPIIIVSGDIKRDALLQMEQMQLHCIRKPIRILPLLDLLAKLTTNRCGADVALQRHNQVKPA
ncbi:response regulator transcription factor [Geobacter sp. DSM 9736]|uniref:response regulator transcription factor n=1 Tax=Geobacter sp. DSM 9736 TaxID=1277350 RepID=UPI000B50C445|nr:response regulator [Geobacter sp. DSM 9736]SNB48012.1 Response regulator receiver domain-containing protein [Geobacter sp. DSM 9736]